MRVLIFCNGEIKDYNRCFSFVEEEDYIIGVDGGTNHLAKMGLQPNVILGDLDSVDRSLLKQQFKNIEIIPFPRKKDYTDTELALDYASELDGMDEIVFLGVVGGRFDHTLGNVFLLKKADEMGVSASMFTDIHEIYGVRGEKLIKGDIGDILSVLPLCDIISGVTLINLEYPLNNATIRLGETIGLSNVFLGKEAHIIIKEGFAVAIKTNKEAVL